MQYSLPNEKIKISLEQHAQLFNPQLFNPKLFNPQLFNSKLFNFFYEEHHQATH